MDRATGDLYEPLLERDLDALPRTLDRYLKTHDERSLFVAIARFAVLAFAPSLHSSRSLLAMRAAWDLREVQPRWRELLLACAAYASYVRPPWSEPPLLERSDRALPLTFLEEAIRAGDRSAADAWLAGNVDEAADLLASLARGEALLVLDAARTLGPLLGAPGRHALMRAVVLSLFSDSSEPSLPIDDLVLKAVEARASIESVRDVLVWCARNDGETAVALEPVEAYSLPRDFAQTLLVHASIRRLPARVDHAALLAAVHENLQHGDDYTDWSG